MGGQGTWCRPWYLKSQQGSDEAGFSGPSYSCWSSEVGGPPWLRGVRFTAADGESSLSRGAPERYSPKREWCVHGQMGVGGQNSVGQTACENTVLWTQRPEKGGLGVKQPGLEGGKQAKPRLMRMYKAKI